MFKDILKGIAPKLKFSAEQVDQWKALENFHDTHPTSDTVPTLPFTCSAPGSATTWTFQRGMPIDWNHGWGVLAGRFDRPHLRTQEVGEGGRTRTGDGGR